MICTGVSWSTWCGEWLVSVLWWSNWCCRCSSITYNCKHHWVVSVTLFSTHMNMKLGKSLDIMPLNQPSTPWCYRRLGDQSPIDDNQWSPSLTSHPTKMEEPQTAVSPWLGLISVAYWWMAGWLATLVSTTSETLVVSTRADKGGETVSHERDLARGCWEGEGNHWLPSIGLRIRPPASCNTMLV